MNMKDFMKALQTQRCVIKLIIFIILIALQVPFKYMLHYSTDVPISIKAILYTPSTHNEKMGMS